MPALPRQHGALQMTTTAPIKSIVHANARPLPMVIYFDGDEPALRALAGLQRYRRIAVSQMATAPQDIEHVYVVTRESQMNEQYDVLRKPNVRVLALTDARFKDPRMDGAIYGYLPASTPGSLVERMVDNAIDHIQLLANRREINERLQMATQEIHQLNQIGAALSAEHNTAKLLEMILTKVREITRSDAGSLYLVEQAELEEAGAEPTTAGEGGTVTDLIPSTEIGAVSKLVKQAESKKRLRFKLAQNDSVNIPFREQTMDISKKSIAGYVAMTGQHVNIEDAYHLPPDVPFSINRKFDEDSGYRTKSILAVPMKNQKDEIVGVLQLINSKRDFDTKLETLSVVLQQVVPFVERQRAIVESLASQAAVALENSQLYEAIQRLFEGFVRAAVIAIEARDPTTSGHSFRVANLTVALAEVADRSESGPFVDLRFTRNEMKEIRYASLLHDFGKVGVREEVLVKAKKLYPSQMDLINQRFQFVKRSMQAEILQSRLDYVLEKGRDEYMQQLPKFEEKMASQLTELDNYFEIILKSNEPTVLAEGNFERLLDIAARRFETFAGEEQNLLNDDEVRLLSIRKGSLDDAERMQIESHVVHTFKFLQQIPWTKEIKSIPAIARGHHEKLNGRGYPFKLSAAEIPIQTRMMTISDIFDALCAVDRPYKRAVALERALEILGFAVKDGEVDATLFELFKEAKVWERWKVEPYPY
ncbi:MAG: metal dependent phosphohydrolase [Acidobacteriales bacterium]|nr:metal dependent phosphohydrolase [Terriglobales bacterium]